MDTERVTLQQTQGWLFSGGMFSLVGGAAIPVAMLIAYLGTRDPVPGQAIATMAVLLGIYFSLMLLAAIMAPGVAERAGEGTTEFAMAGIAANGDVAELELMDRVPLQLLAPVTIGVARATGVCPLGFRPGDTWVISGDGHLSRPMCWPALAASTSILREWAAEGVRIEAPCRCPLARELVFAVEDGS